jgi:16S rRNA (guanine1207-N2)-methyltransferase
MIPISQLIWRNIDKIGDPGRLLTIAPPEDDLVARLESGGFQTENIALSHASHACLQAAGVKSDFGFEAVQSTSWPRIILFQPREKALLEMLLDLCGTILEKDGELWLAGENRAGIKSAGKRLKNWFSSYRKIDSARHCTLFSARNPKAESPFDLHRHSAQWELQVGERTLTLHSLPGVFAHGRFDLGTRLLVDTLADPALAPEISGRVLDFACGSGAIGLALLTLHPGLDVTLLDDSALALECARRSLGANELQGTLVASDGVSELLDNEQIRFDWVVSNPPFHRGVKQDLEIARQFVADVPKLLEPGGRLCLVANMHLPYRRWLEELFGKVQVLAADREYNVWLASKAKDGNDKQTRKK